MNPTAGGPVAFAPQTGRSDRVAAIVIFIASAMYSRLAFTFRPFLRTEALGPATFPLLVGTLMLACSTALLVASLRPVRTGAIPRADGAPPAAGRNYLPALVLWALLAGYSLLFDWLGFPLSTALFVFFAMLLLEVKPWWRAVILTAVFTAAAWYLFTTLDVRLPSGEIFRK